MVASQLASPLPLISSDLPERTPAGVDEAQPSTGQGRQDAPGREEAVALCSCRPAADQHLVREGDQQGRQPDANEHPQPLGQGIYVLERLHVEDVRRHAEQPHEHLMEELRAKERPHRGREVEPAQGETDHRQDLDGCPKAEEGEHAPTRAEGAGQRKACAEHRGTDAQEECHLQRRDAVEILEDARHAP
eukprot:CAMPEP_0175238558 /NCGR_PEP_ID=MMETSP0093-20121207/29096_1 /TAXON_ID=311494 /ORGANISM="Alexandrium monilatum, Strain CCMP3105" /LENGTH=189 /DNA_ID=CAMNT_0016532569 /DNA_START=228 /DNA_END=799 /DNA_ORIENTATION=+